MTDHQQIRALIKELDDMFQKQSMVADQLTEALSNINTSREDMAELLDMAKETRMTTARLIYTAAMIAKEKETGSTIRELFRKRHDLIAAVH